MIKALITDFSRVLFFPKERKYLGSLNGLHKTLSVQSSYKILDHFELDIPLLEYYTSLAKQLSVYIFTSETIQDAPELQRFLQPIFKDVFSAMKMGLDKKEVSAYQQLAKEIQLSPAEIIYIDDSESNILAAQKAGLQTILFKNNDSLKRELQAKLEE